MYLLLSFISNLDFKPLFVAMEAISGSVYRRSVNSKETGTDTCKPNFEAFVEADAGQVLQH